MSDLITRCGDATKNRATYVFSALFLITTVRLSFKAVMTYFYVDLHVTLQDVAANGRKTHFDVLCDPFVRIKVLFCVWAVMDVAHIRELLSKAEIATSLKSLLQGHSWAWSWTSASVRGWWISQTPSVWAERARGFNQAQQIETQRKKHA